LNQIEYAALRVLAPLLVVQAMAEQGYLLPTFTALNGSKSAQQKELALTSLMPSDWRGGPLPLSLQSLVGTNIRKPFKTSHGVGWFCGVVANAKAGGVYKVKYTDGDFEDIYPEDVKLWKQMEPATYAHPAVGIVVQKTFNGKQYTGRVMFVADDLYRVWYPEDGDAEDLTLDEFDRLTVVASTIPQPEATTDAADPKRTQLGEGGTASPTVGPGGGGGGGYTAVPFTHVHTTRNSFQTRAAQIVQRPFTAAELTALKTLWVGDAAQVLLRTPTRNLSRKTFSRTQDGRWVDDELINAYLEVLHRTKGTERIQFFSTFYWESLVRDGLYNHTNVRPTFD
jgi:hypothetical protein